MQEAQEDSNIVLLIQINSLRSVMDADDRPLYFTIGRYPVYFLSSSHKIHGNLNLTVYLCRIIVEIVSPESRQVVINSRCSYLP